MMLLTSTLVAQTVPLISQQELKPFGLKRDWFHQLKIHSAGGEIQGVLLEGGQLFITTSDSVLHVLDAETGQWLWSRSVGRRDVPMTEPAVNSRVVAVHNSLELFLFNRHTGMQLLQISLSEAAAAPCEMSEHYLYVPLVNQTILVYPLREAAIPLPYQNPDTSTVKQADTLNDPELDKIIQQFEEARRLLKKAEPEAVQENVFVLDSSHRIPITVTALGTVNTKPLLLSQFYDWERDDEGNPTHEINKLTHQEFFSWVTEQGFLYTAAITQFTDQGTTMLYRVDSAGQSFYMDRSRGIQIERPGNKELVSRSTQSQPYPVHELDRELVMFPGVIVSGGRSANIFAVESQSGNVLWQYPTRGQLLEPIAIIGMDVYAPTTDSIMHAIDLFSGKERWSATNVKRFVASSQNRVYVLDRRGRLMCLDRATGIPVWDNVYDLRRFEHCLFNLETDQIILITNTGLVQCLRELQFEAERSVSLRHRIDSIESANAALGGDMPVLWWTSEIDTSETQGMEE